MFSLLNKLFPRSKNGRVSPEDLPIFCFATKPDKKILKKNRKTNYHFPEFHKVKSVQNNRARKASQIAFAEIRQEFEPMISREEAQTLFDIFLKTECSVARTAEYSKRPIEQVHLALEHFGVTNPYRPEETYRTESLLV